MAGPTTISISYDAATQAYTFTTGGVNQSFGPAQIDAAASNSTVTVYKRVSGNVTDTLTLTKPGTSGTLNYQYVGAGYFQRTTQSSSTISATIDAFIYGVPVSDAAVRRTGAARYAVDLLGVYAYTDQPVSLGGTGTLDIDFETLKIITSGQYTEVNANGQQTGTGGWTGAATMSSTANAFSGSGRVGSINSALTGLLYGPNSQEVGAVFSGFDTQGIAVVATLLGRKTQELTSAATNKDLVNLTKDVGFITNAQSVRYSVDGSGAYQSVTYRGRSASISYKADTKTYTVFSDAATVNFPGGASFEMSPATADAAASDSRFAAYTSTSFGNTGTLKLYRPAGSNSELQLTYTGLGLLETSKTGERTQTWFIYGLPTGSGGDYAEPTGSATYSGKIFGIATGTQPSGGVGQLSGDASLSVNFTGLTLTGSMNPIATFADGSTLNLGTYNFFNGVLRSGQPNGFSAAIQGPGDDTGNLGGYFFGNLYTEFGASFSTSTVAPLGVNKYFLNGVIVGKKN